MWQDCWWPLGGDLVGVIGHDVEEGAPFFTVTHVRDAKEYGRIVEVTYIHKGRPKGYSLSLRGCYPVQWDFAKKRFVPWADLESGLRSVPVPEGHPMPFYSFELQERLKLPEPPPAPPQAIPDGLRLRPKVPTGAMVMAGLTEVEKLSSQTMTDFDRMRFIWQAMWRAGDE